MLKVYTDGAVSNNGYENSRGGWAYVILDENDNVVRSASGHVEPATNNICELMALIEGCHAAVEFDREATVVVYTDSSYAQRCYKEGWWRKWLSNGWINSKKERVANIDLWRKLIPFFRGSHFTFEKCKGHSGDFWNEFVDKLAVKAKEKK